MAVRIFRLSDSLAGLFSANHAMPAPLVARKAAQQTGKPGGRSSEKHRGDASPPASAQGSGFKKKVGGLEQSHSGKHVPANGRKPSGHEAKAGSSSAPRNSYIRDTDSLEKAVPSHSHRYSHDGVSDFSQTRVRSGIDALYAGGEGLPRRINFLPARHPDAHSALPVGLKPLNAADPSREPRGRQPVVGSEGDDRGKAKEGKRKGEKERRESSERERDGLEGRLDRSDVALEWRQIRPIGAGLSNLGNTCFMNSVLQCLTYTPPLANYLSQSPHSSTCRVAGWCALCEMESHVPRAVGGTGKVVSPTGFVRNVKSVARSFKAGRQEDAHEYMRCLLDALHRCCLPPKRASASGSAADPAFAPRLMNTFVHRTFGGYLCSQVQCTVCGYCSRTYDPFLDLSLEIVRADSVTKALHRFTSEEALDGANKYKCSKCRKKVRALKSFAVEEAPPVLTVHLKRFAALTGRKLDKHVAFPPSLDLSPFMTSSRPSTSSCGGSSREGGGGVGAGGGGGGGGGDSRGGKYSLYGVLVHAGWSTNSGHYYCYVRGPSGTWSAMDDARVQQVSEKTVLQQRAYLLFYVRQTPPPAAAAAAAAAAGAAAAGAAGAAAGAAGAAAGAAAAGAAAVSPSATARGAQTSAAMAPAAAAGGEADLKKKGKAAAPHVEAFMHVHAQGEAQEKEQAEAQGVTQERLQESAGRKASKDRVGAAVGEGTNLGSSVARKTKERAGVKGEGSGAVTMDVSGWQGAVEALVEGGKWEEREGQAVLAEASSDEESSEEGGEQGEEGGEVDGEGGAVGQAAGSDSDDDSDDPDWTLGDEDEQDAEVEEGGKDDAGRVRGSWAAAVGQMLRLLPSSTRESRGSLRSRSSPGRSGGGSFGSSGWGRSSGSVGSIVGSSRERMLRLMSPLVALPFYGARGEPGRVIREKGRREEEVFPLGGRRGRKRRRAGMEGWGRGVGWEGSGGMAVGVEEEGEGVRKERERGGMGVQEEGERRRVRGEEARVVEGGEGKEEVGRRQLEGGAPVMMAGIGLEEGEVDSEEEEEGEAMMMAGPGVVVRRVGSSDDDSEGVVTYGGSDAVWMMREGAQEANVGAGGLACSQWGDDEGMAMNGAHLHVAERRPTSKYRYDEWDEELDRGRVKKVKRKGDDDAPDPMAGEQDSFSRYSGYIARAAGPGGDEWAEYDARAMADYFRARPLLVARRLAQIGAVMGGWAGKRWADAKLGRAEETFQERAGELRQALVLLGPAFCENRPGCLLPPEYAERAIPAAGPHSTLPSYVSSLRPNAPTTPLFLPSGRDPTGDVIPPEYVDELSLLQDRIAPFPTRTALDLIEAELGVPVDLLFDQISPSPVAAASLGQVYEARLRAGGQRVAVKVQRPGVRAAIALDIFILRLFAGWLRQYRRLNTDLQAVVDEWATSLFREMDYEMEAQNGIKFAELFGRIDRVVVPRMYPELTTRRVLIMEWIDVRCACSRSIASPPYLTPSPPLSPLLSLPSSLCMAHTQGQRLADSKDVSLVEVGVYCSLSQLLDYGFYHADPHPGNFLLTRDNRLAYLDFGMMGRMDRDVREAFIRAAVHLVNREFDLLAGDFITLGLLPPGQEMSEVSFALTAIFKDAVSTGIRNISFGSLATQLGQTMYNFKFRLPAYFSLVVRSLSVLEGIALKRDPNYKVIASSYPWIAKKVLTDPSPQLHSTVTNLLFKDGQFRVSRLESLLKEVCGKGDVRGVREKGVGE
ncbi:unnamed protein product [Closterium sp. Yama58-4]|nr:unnamed protein product [Closterium sp. Yama58-4]